MKIKYLLSILILTATSVSFAVTQDDISDIQHGWAVANYDTPEDQQEAAFENLTTKARQLVEANPEDAAAKVWLSIVLSTDAGVNGGLGALGKVKEARKLLEAAEKINPEVLDGSIYTSLGSLYYKVPGWPIAFGNDKKARQYLQKALQMNPQGIDPNYFYADFLLENDHPAEAIPYLEKAKNAPARPNRPLADKGRQMEIDAAIKKAKSMIN